MTAVLNISGVDVEATLGCAINDLGAYLDTAIGAQVGTAIPGVPGVIKAGPFGTDIREFTVVGTFDGAGQSAVRANLRKLQALVGDPDVTHLITMADWPTVQILAKCEKMTVLPGNASSRANSQNAIEVVVSMLFRAPNPYWQDITPTSTTFMTSPVAMAQGTAPGHGQLITDTTAAAADVVTVKDYLGNVLWSFTLAARSSGERYRITLDPGIMTIEKYSSGVWSNSDASLTAGVFPRPFPSSGAGYQTSSWPTIESTHGNWTYTRPLQWR